MPGDEKSPSNGPSTGSGTRNGGERNERTRGKRIILAAAALAIAALVIAGLVVCRHVSPGPAAPTDEDSSMIQLPNPDTQGKAPLESLLQSRRSHRKFAPDALELPDLGQILWAAQGCTTDRCFRTAPSAGGTFPLELYAVIGTASVMGLDAGVYHYKPKPHALELIVPGDHRSRLASEALAQNFIAEAPATIVIAADYSRTAKVYGARATRYVDMEVGHAGQNVYLEAEALGLGTVAVGAFRDAGVGDVIELPPGLDALYILPIGKPLD